MRIAYIVPSLASLGPIIVVRNLTHEMTSHGHDCKVFYFDDKPNPMSFACPTEKISFWHPADMSLYDMVHVHCFRPMIYAGRFCAGKTVVTLHSYFFIEYFYTFGRVLGWLLGRVAVGLATRFDRVVVLSNDAKTYYSRWISQEKLRVCYNGVTIAPECSDDISADLDRIRQFKDSSILIGCISELVKIKDVGTMIRALQLLPASFKLLLIGSGKAEKDLRGQVAAAGLDDRVLFLGERVEAHRFLPEIDIFAMTSLSEGFCMSLVEAAMYGRKIVCADILGMREKFTDEAVTFFSPRSADDLAAALLLAWQEAGKPDKARKTAEERFSTSNMYSRYMDIYGEVQS